MSTQFLFISDYFRNNYFYSFYLLSKVIFRTIFLLISCYQYIILPDDRTIFTSPAYHNHISIISIIVLYLPCFILVPLMVCYINGAREFGDIFILSLFIMYIMGLFDRFFVDWYWVEHTKAWDIPNTEEL